MAASAAAGQKAFGIDRGMPFPLEDIPGAEVILLPGGNPAETMPPIMQYFEAQRARGGKLIVADPRRTPTARAADLHLALSPGTDAALANGLLHIIMRDKLIDTVFIGTRTTGFEAVRRVCHGYWPDRVERITGVPAADIERAAHMLGNAATAMVLTARGAEQQSHGTDNVLAYINVLLALGRAGRKHSGYGCLTGQGNGQGGREHGQKADQLPGYRKLNDPAARAYVASVWGVEADSLPKPGLSACELFAEFGGSVRGLMVMGSNVLVSTPDAEVLAGGLGGLDMLVVADIFLSETAARADVVLPIAQWAEEDGTMTNLEGRVLRRRRALPPPPGVRTDADILADLARRLGCTAAFDTAPEAAFAELRRASSGGAADYAGISYARIDAEDGVFWPCADADHPGTPRLFLDRFGTEDGRARFHAIEYRGSAEQPDRKFPYTLTTGRLLSHYQTGAQTRRVPELVEAEPASFVALHPDLARGLGIAEGDAVCLTTRRGRLVLPARITRDIRLDTVFVDSGVQGMRRACRPRRPAEAARGGPQHRAWCCDFQSLLQRRGTMIDSKPRFLQGVFEFTGGGYHEPMLLDRSLIYKVPLDKRAQLVYLRAGNSGANMIYISLIQDGKPVRLFPVAGHGATHVPLAVIEDIEPDTEIKLYFAAPAGAAGTAVIDLGLIEI
jgi:assimilatory nitrate reductase catalytic subunit